MEKIGKGRTVRMKIIAIFCLVFLVSCTTKDSLHEAQLNYNRGNFSQAFNLLLKLKNEDNSQIQYTIGYMYYYGLGTAKDQDLGRYWINKAAQKKYPPAIEGLRLITQSHEIQYNPLQHITYRHNDIPYEKY